NERPVPGTPLYFGATSEFVHILQDAKDVSTNPVKVVDASLSRMDFAPQVRFPFKKWQWFTVNSTLGWRDTFYTRSYDPTSVGPDAVIPRTIIDSSLNRTVFTLNSQLTGPVFN